MRCISGTNKEPMTTLTTDREVQAAKAIDGKPTTDFLVKGAPGLRLRVMKSGFKSWSLIYTRNGDGKRRRVSLGEYPAMGLKDAKQAAQRLRLEASDGGDPATRNKGQAPGNDTPLTFAGLAEAYMQKHAKPSKRTWRDDANKLASHILPRIGATPANEVTKRDVIGIIDYIATERGAPVQADRTAALISSIFNWSRDEDLVQNNPADRIRKRSVRKRRTRLLSHDELRALWAWCEQPGSETERRCRIVIRLAILLGQRRNQIASARKIELIGLGSGKPAFHIPHARNKNKDDLHVVPLPAMAEKLFKEALAMSGDSAFVFPSEVKPLDGKAIALHPDTVTDEIAIARKELKFAPTNSGEEAVLHGLRHLVKTELKRLGIPADVRRRIQSHRSKTSTTDMDEWYDHADYYDADREALDAWEGRLLSIVQG
jgi:integrase